MLKSYEIPIFPNVRSLWAKYGEITNFWWVKSIPTSFALETTLKPLGSRALELGQTRQPEDHRVPPQKVSRLEFELDRELASSHGSGSTE